MSIESRSRGVRIVRRDGSTEVLDVRCGGCATCRAGLDYWCMDARPEGVTLFSLGRPVVHDELRRWMGALAALATAPLTRASVLLVMEDLDQAVAGELVRPWHDGPVLTSPDGRDEATRTRLADLSPTGRAQAVLVLRHARTAVRAVERGGRVCLPDAGVEAPSVTELVQRDVTLVGARRVGDLVARTSWKDLGSRLSQLLATDSDSVQVAR